jgi:hypothetical protein
MAVEVFIIQAIKRRQELDDVWFQVKMSDIGYHGWELVAIGANKSLNDVVKSLCHALTCSTFSALSSSFSDLL